MKVADVDRRLARIVRHLKARAAKPAPSPAPQPSPSSAPAAPVPVKYEPVQQPPGAYPKYAYKLRVEHANGSRETITLAAYNDELAEKQARSLCGILRWTYVSVRRGQELPRREKRAGK